METSVADNAIDFASMLQRLRQVACQGFLAMESVWIDWKDCKHTDNIAETLLLRQIPAGGEGHP